MIFYYSTIPLCFFKASNTILKASITILKASITIRKASDTILQGQKKNDFAFFTTLICSMVFRQYFTIQNFLIFIFILIAYFLSYNGKR